MKTLTEHENEILKLIKQAAYSRGSYQVFNDFLETSAIAISNAVDPTHRKERETRYMKIIHSYDKKHQQLFPLMLFHLTEALEKRVQFSGPEDILGVLFHEMELHNKYSGQFFTPQNVSDMMALMACGDKLQEQIKEKGFITMNEPACGSGVMITSFCKAMKSNNLNYCGQLVVTAADCDLKCVHMTYLQLALYGMPAVVIHGNSLSFEEWSRWYTLVYLMNGWIWRARCGITDGFCPEDETIKCAMEPMYAVIRSIEGLFSKNTADAEDGSVASVSASEMITKGAKAAANIRTEQKEKLRQMDLFTGFEL